MGGHGNAPKLFRDYLTSPDRNNTSKLLSSGGTHLPGSYEEAEAMIEAAGDILGFVVGKVPKA